jgi:hypothetical protein
MIYEFESYGGVDRQEGARRRRRREEGGVGGIGGYGDVEGLGLRQYCGVFAVL